MSPLVLASSHAGSQIVTEIAAGLHPRLDYLCIADALGAEVLDTELSARLPSWRRTLERTLASDLTQANLAWQRRRRYSAWLSTSEKVGLPLALRGQGGPPHVLIAHHLTSGRKRGLHRLTGVLKRFASIICVSEAQAVFLREDVGFPAARVQHVWDNVDDRFFCPPSDMPEGDCLLAVGRENRDYTTLIEAMRLLNLPLTIVSSSLWSSREFSFEETVMPPCVHLRRDFVSYPELRTLYARARLVIVPLTPSPYAAGVNGVLEAMAMGKPTIVTRSPGLAEYVQDGATNVLVPPGNPQVLAEAVSALWNDTARCRYLGMAARRRVENTMGMDAYAQHVASIVRESIGGN